MPARHTEDLIHLPGMPKNARIRRKSVSDANPAPVQPDPPEAPAYLSIGAAEVWGETVKLMIARRTWCPTFTPTLAMFSMLSDEFRSSAGQLPATKLTILRLLQNDLGLSPSTVDTVSRVSSRPNAPQRG